MNEGNGTHTFPEQAVKAAIEQQDDITPRLLRVLEDTGKDVAAVRGQSEYMLHIVCHVSTGAVSRDPGLIHCCTRLRQA